MPIGTLQGAGRVYLDHNATTPLEKGLPQKIQEWLNQWGNPSSIHREGRGPKLLLREARKNLSQFLNIHPLELIFTSGGSESNNTVLHGVWEYYRHAERSEKYVHKKRLIISEVEHPSLMKTAAHLESLGAEVIRIRVNRQGFLDLKQYEEALNEDVFLVSIMLANNETGNIFPIKELAAMAHRRGLLFHTDAVQALGKMQVDLQDLGVDYASFSGHKIYALKGVGLLYAKKMSPYTNLIYGGGQERARRGGTENILAIASLGEVAKFKAEVPRQMERIQKLRDHLELRMRSEIEGLEITGAAAPRLANTSSVIIQGVDGESLLMNLDLRGFAVSTGAACSSGNPEPSPVLLNMGLSREEAQSSMRVGLGWGTTEEHIDQFMTAFREVVQHLRSVTLTQEGVRA